MPDKKPLTFCIDWMRGRAEHTPMPASRATMESIVAYLEELESLKETPDPKSDIQTAVCTGQNCPMQASTADPANCACVETCRWATRPRTNGDTIRAMSDEELAGPSADVAPVVHGRWERDADGDWHCTNCDETVAICESGKERTYRKPYCPNCGAKMDEEETDR